MEPDLVGQTIGKYRILEEVGRGGMSVVYRAYDTVLERDVALKLLLQHLAWDQEFVTRFLQEARVAAGLRHDNIVVIHDVGQADDYYFIAMEYLEGETVSAMVRRTGAMAVENVEYVVSQVADALDDAHRSGIIHRDVKPANIMVGPGGDVTLMDFGLVKALAGTQLTRTGTLMGTPAYMSPEQVRELRELTPATDIYNLGLVAYEMLTGCVAFEGKSSAAVMFKQVHEMPAPLRQVRPELPPAIETAVMAALDKEPEARWPTAGEFAEGVRRARTEGEAAPPTAEGADGNGRTGAAPPASRARPPRKPDGERGGLLGPLVGVVLAAMIVGGIAVFGDDIAGLVEALRATATPTPPTATTLLPTPTGTPTPTATYTAIPTPTWTLTPEPTAANTRRPTLPPPTPAATPTEPVWISFYPDNWKFQLPSDQHCAAVNWETRGVTDVEFQIGDGNRDEVKSSGRHPNICFSENELMFRLFFRLPDGREDMREFRLERK